MGAPIDKGLVMLHNTKTGRYLKMPLELLPAGKRTVRGLLEHFNIDVEEKEWYARDRTGIKIDLERPLVPGDRIRWADNDGNAILG